MKAGARQWKCCGSVRRDMALEVCGMGLRLLWLGIGLFTGAAPVRQKVVQVGEIGTVAVHRSGIYLRHALTPASQEGDPILLEERRSA